MYDIDAHVMHKKFLEDSQLSRKFQKRTTFIFNTKNLNGYLNGECIKFICIVEFVVNEEKLYSIILLQQFHSFNIEVIDKCDLFERP